MAPTFDDLVTLQRTADGAHAEVQRLYDAYGRTSSKEWTDVDRVAWQTAWKAWVDAVRDVQEAVTAFADEHRAERGHLEAAVKRAARPSGPAA